ncbi:MAG: VanW family protein [Armatimonadota bacterium]
MSRIGGVFGIVIPVVSLACLAVFVTANRHTALGAFTTSMQGRSPEQSHNIRRAVETLDGSVVRPGQVFSFNRTVGSCSAERGYADAPTIVEGKLEESPGGGICQVSSTLYNAALLAGMEVVERNPHSSPVRSVPPGRDATVVFGGPDLRFRNNLPEPVTIDASVSGDRLSIKLVGRDSQKSKFAVAVETDDSVRPVSSSANSGRTRYCTATVWREKIVDGRKSDREFISSDTYKMVP